MGEDILVPKSIFKQLSLAVKAKYADLPYISVDNLGPKALLALLKQPFYNEAIYRCITLHRGGRLPLSSSSPYS